MSIVDFMRVSPPPPASLGVRRNDITGIKLARHIAVLFGIDIPENPTETVWVSDFNKLTVGDIGRGAPKLTTKSKQSNEDRRPGYLPLKGWYLLDRALVAGPSGKKSDTLNMAALHVDGVEEVPSATLNRFKPDTKSAALLAGAEHLFAGLEEVFRDVTRVLGTLEDGTQLADCMRIGSWASLLAEVYRCQPALFTATVQARLTQRAAVSNWRPVVLRDRAPDSASCEFDENENDDFWEPVTLGILDGAIRNHVRPTLGPGEPDQAAGASGGDDPNRDYLIDGLVDRWCRHLTQSSDRGLTWVVQEGRRRRVEIYKSGLTPLSRFLAEVLLLSPKILPYGSPERIENWATFTPEDEAHRRRVRPRIPSQAELSPLPKTSQEAIVHTLICLQRVLQSVADFRHPEMRQEVSDDQRRVAELSQSLWGPNAALSVLSKHMWLRERAIGERERDPEVVDKFWPDLMETVRQLRRLRDAGELSSGEWVDIFSTVSPTVNSRSRDLAARNNQGEGSALREELLKDWNDVLRLLNIGSGTDNTGPSTDGTPDASLTRIALLLHNYLGIALTSETVSERVNAVRLGQKVVLPVRRLVAEDRKNDTVARQSAQIIVRAAARLATETQDAAIRSEMLDVCRELLNEILQSKLVKELRNGSKVPRDSSDLNVLNAISEAALALLEAGVEPIPVSLLETQHLLGLTEAALSRLSHGRNADTGSETSRARDFELHRRRWKKLASGDVS